jgi:hypothetical protein
MNISTKTKKASLLIATVGTIVILLSIVIVSGFEKPKTVFQPEEHLFIDATYLLKISETNSSVNVTCTPYLTNIWEKPSGKIKAIVYVMETKNNIAVYKNTVNIGEISADSTAEIQIPLVLSNSSYKVDILFFENEKLVIKGGVTIHSRSFYIWNNGTQLNEQQWDVAQSSYEYENIR